MAVYSALMFVVDKQGNMGKATSVCSDLSNIMECLWLVNHDFIANYLMDHWYSLLRRLILFVVRMYTFLYWIHTSITAREMWNSV